MRVYHERLRVPAYWWPAGLLLTAMFGAEFAGALSVPLAVTVFGLLAAAWLAALVLTGRTAVEVTGGELRAGKARLPLEQAGEVTALDAQQTRLLRGSRADARAVVVTRPYLKRAVYVEIAGSCPAAPYWLVGTRRPEDLAAAIGKSRPVARPGELPVG